MNGLYKIDWGKVLYAYAVCFAIIYASVIIVVEVQAKPKTIMEVFEVKVPEIVIPISVQYFGGGFISLILLDYRSKYERLPKR